MSAASGIGSLAQRHQGRCLYFSLGFSFACGSKMAAAINTVSERLKDKGKEAVTFIRKSNSHPKILRIPPLLFYWPELSHCKGGCKGNVCSSGI